MDIQYILKIDLFITGIVYTIFGIIVFVKIKNKTVRNTLSLMLLAVIIWSFSFSKWMSIYDDPKAALFWTRMLSIGSTAVTLFYYHWVVSLLNRNARHKKSLIVYYIIVFIMELFVFHPWFVKNVAPTAGFAFWPKAGWLYTVYIIVVFFGLIIYSHYILFKDFFKAKGIQRAKIRYVIIGSMIGFTGAMGNFFFWYGDTIWDNLTWLGCSSVLVVMYPILFSYSIIKYKLMDIKLVLRSSTVYLGIIITISSIALILNKLLLLFNINSSWVNLITIIILFLFIPYIKQAYHKIANQYFFTSLYDGQKIIADLSEKLSSTLNINEIYHYIAKIFMKSLRPKSMAIFEYKEKTNSYTIIFNEGFKINSKQRIKLDKNITNNYIAKNIPLIIEEKENDELPMSTLVTLALLKKLNIELLSPLNSKNGTIGFIALSGKESRDMYNDDDIALLKTAGNQIALTLENAILYNDIKVLYNNIKEKNEHLKELLYMKSDFLNIISHQLNTPLSIMRYALSSVEENYIPMKKSMGFAKKGLERISSTIDDFIYAYELEGKKMKMNPKVTNIQKIISAEVKEKKKIIKTQKKKINIIIKKTNKNIPEVFCDHEKIAHVISTILENSINYTKEGNITISYGFKTKQNNKLLKIYITDTGVGIKKKDQKKLFKKFIRSEDAKLLHPDGSGLGLYISKKIAESNNGELKLENTEEGVGSTFSLSLPIT